MRRLLQNKMEDLKLSFQEQDHYNSGSLSVAVVKRVLFKDLGVVCNPDDMTRYLASFLDDEGNINYESMLIELDRTDGSQPTKNFKYLIDAIERAGTIRFLAFAEGKCQYGQNRITRDSFKQVLDHFEFSSQMVRLALDKFNELDTENTKSLKISALRNYLRYPKSKQLSKLRNWTASQFSSPEELSGVFKQLDVGSRGSLHVDKVVLAFFQVGLDGWDMSSLKELFNDIGLVQSNGHVNYLQLVKQLYNDTPAHTVAKAAYSYNSKPKSLFHQLDLKGTGQLSRKVFAKFVRQICEELTSRQVDSVFDQFDVNQNDFLDLKEFTELLKHGNQVEKVHVHPVRETKLKVSEENSLLKAFNGWSEDKCSRYLNGFADKTHRLSKSKLVRALESLPENVPSRRCIHHWAERFCKRSSVSVKSVVQFIMRRTTPDDSSLFSKTIDDESLRKILLEIDAWTLRRLFFSHDTDSNGQLSHAQFANVLETAGIKSSRSHIRNVVQSLGKILGTSEYITYDDLMGFVSLSTNTFRSRTTENRSLDLVQICADQAEKYDVNPALLLKKLDNIAKKSSGKLKLDLFFRVIDSALHFKHVTESQIEEFLRVRGAIKRGSIDYERALDCLFGSFDYLSSICQEIVSNGFSTSKSITAIFDLLNDSSSKKYLSHNLFSQGMASLGVRDGSVIKRIIREFSDHSERVEYGIFVKRLLESRNNKQYGLEHEKFGNSKRRPKNLASLDILKHELHRVASRSELQAHAGWISKHNFKRVLTMFVSRELVDEALVGIDEDPVDMDSFLDQVYRSDEVFQTASLMKENSQLRTELKSFDQGFFDQVEDLKNSYKLAMERNRVLEEHLWTQCAEESGLPPPIDHHMEKIQSNKAPLDKVERALASTVARSTTNTERAQIASLGDRLKLAVKDERNVLQKLRNAFEMEKRLDGEVDEGCSISSKSFSRVISDSIPDLQHYDVEEIQKKFDKDGDGQIRYKEFLHIVEALVDHRGNDSNSPLGISSDGLFESGSFESLIHSSFENSIDSSFENSIDSSSDDLGELDARDIFRGRQAKLEMVREQLRSALTKWSVSSGGHLNLLEAFKKIDSNRSGTIDESEFQRLMHDCQLDKTLSSLEQHMLFTEMDIDKQGMVKFEAFCRYFDMINSFSPSPRGQDILDDRLRSGLIDAIGAFPMKGKFMPDRSMFDSPSGKLSRRDFHRLLNEAEPIPLSVKEKDQVLDEIDVDGDGEVSYNELKAYINRPASSPLKGTSRRAVELETLEAKLRSFIYKLASKSNGRIDLKSAFCEFDKSGTGTVTVKGFRHALRSFGFRLVPAEEVSIMKHFDQDRNGVVTFPEFIRFFENESSGNSQPKKWKLNHQLESKVRDGLRRLQVGPTLRRQFDRFDKNKTGELLPSEFKTMLSSLGFKLTDDNIDYLQSRFSTANISFAEFQAFVDFEKGSKNPLHSSVVQKLRGSKVDLYRLFKDYDTDDRGTLEATELEEALDSIGLRLTAQEMNILLNKNNIRYTEFICNELIDRTTIMRHFQKRYPNETMFHVFSRLVAAGQKDTILPPMLLKRAIRQAGLSIPEWQLSALFHSIGVSEHGIRLSAFCHALEVETHHEEEPSSLHTGTIASLLLLIRNAIQLVESSRLETSFIHNSDSEEQDGTWIEKRYDINKFDLQHALELNCGIALGASDTEVIFKLIDEGGTALMTRDEITTAILSNDTLRLALDVDRETDPGAVSIGRKVAHDLRIALLAKCESTDARRAFKVLDCNLKGWVDAEGVMKACADYGWIISSPWELQEIMLLICNDNAVRFASSMEIRLADISAWLFPLPARLENAQNRIRSAVRDSARRGGGACDFKAVFDRMDTRSRGYLTRKSLYSAFSSLCPELQHGQIQTLVNSMDASSDGGRIMYSDFVAYFS